MKLKNTHCIFCFIDVKRLAAKELREVSQRRGNGNLTELQPGGRKGGSVLREVRVRLTSSVERTDLGRGSGMMMTTATAITVPKQYVTWLTLFHPGRTLNV